MKKLNINLNLSGNKYFVGQLFESQKSGIVFEYDPEFLETGFNLSPHKLGFQTGIQTAELEPFDGLFGVFADSLPDGWGMLLMNRYFQKAGSALSQISPLDRLAFIADTGIGALSYHPPSVRSATFFDVDLEKLAQESQQVLEGEESLILDQLLDLGGSPGGARPKVLVGVLKDQIVAGTNTLPSGFAPWMIKFCNRKLESLDAGIIEYVYSLVAKEVDIRMTETRLFGSNQDKFFGIKRFDWNGTNKLHVHTLAGLLHADFRLPNLDYENLLQVIQYLCADIEEIKEGFRRMSFNIIFCNQDDHAKNFSFIFDGSAWQLSPVYDLTFSPSRYAEQFMSVGGKGKDIDDQDLVNLGLKFGLKRDFCKDYIALLRSKRTELIKKCKQYGARTNSIETMRRVFVSD